MKSTGFYKLYSLLKQDVRRQLVPLVIVVLLASVVAFGAKAPLMLAVPLWGDVLFPGEVSAVTPGDRTALYQGFLDGFGALRDRLGHGLYGAGELTSDQQRYASLWAVSLLMVVVSALAAAALYAQYMLSRWIAVRMVIDLRVRLARHLMQLSLRYHGERRFGDLLSRMSSDVTLTLQVVHTAMRDLVQQPLMVLFSLIVAAAVAPLPTLAFLAILPLAAVPIAVLGRRVRKRSRRSLDKLGDSTEVLTQVFSGIRTVKAFRAEERELERYRVTNEGYLAAAMKMSRAIATIRASSHLVSYIGFALLLVGVGWISIKQQLFGSSQDMIAFFGAIGMIYQHTKRITQAINQVQESSGAAERLQALLDEPTDIVERPGARQLEGLGSGVQLEDVGFAYAGSQERALDAVSLQVRPGETLALVGPSGAGKTTLVDLIGRFIEPDQGRVTVDGTDLRDTTLDSWTALYALVGQIPFLFHDTLRENILYGRPDATQAEVEAAARAAHIHEFIESLPEGYDTVVGDEGSRLSGGQRQRITIARAFLKGAPLLLLDEATSALDSDSEAEVQRALDELMEGHTVIVIAHRLSTIRTADRIAVLEGGRLVELGSHEELIAKKGVYARLHRVQFPEDREVSV